MLYLLLTALAFLPLTHFTAADFPLLRDGDVAGWTLAPAEYYDGTQLYGYINGGAEVYREYGFDRVAAQRLASGKHEVQVDIYRMSSPQAAYGIYSASRGRCRETMNGCRWSCLTDYQAQFCRDDYYVNITVMDRSAESRTAARKAGAAVLSRIRGADYTLPGEISGAAGDAPVQYVRGPLAAAQTMPDWLPLLDGIGRYELFATRKDTKTGTATLATFSFKSARDAGSFLDRIGAGERPGRGKWLTVKTGKKHAAVFLHNDKRLRYVEADSQAAVTAVTSKWTK